jgi:PHD/YefM family antitoxin component YafN of YafNO toxin-antitoxin module
MVKKWEDNQKVAVVVTDQGSKMANVICESRWNVRHECEANHAKKAFKKLIHSADQHTQTSPSML